MRPLLRRLTWWLQRRRKEDELREELQFHLEAEVEERQSDGLPEGDARRLAYRDLGNATMLREDVRTLWSWTLAEQFAQDVRHATRMLRRFPGFAAVAVLTIALGIGAATAVYSVVSATLLRPLPYDDAGRLVRIVENVPAEESPSGLPLLSTSMTSDAFLWWRDEAKTLSGIAGILAYEVTARIDDDLRRLSAARVSPSLFAMLGTPPAAGRGLDARDERASVAVLSADAWVRWFSRDPDIVGRTLVLDGVTHTIVGVMPSDFAVPTPDTDVWTPYVVEPNEPQRIVSVDVIAKLRDGVSIDAASAEARILGDRYLGLAMEGAAAPGPARFEVAGLQDRLVEPVKPALQALLAAVALVLMIVCANIANLLTARGFARQRELGIRRALGAGQGRVIRQLLTESLVLSVAGGLVATALAYGGLRFLKFFTAVTLPALYGGNSTLVPGIERVGIDAGVLRFALLATLASGLLCGVMPALHLSRAALSAAAGYAGPSGIRWARRGAGSILTVGQLAMATMLLVGSGLLIRTFVELSRVDLGYDPANALTFELVLPRELEGSRRLALANALATDLATLPGVQAAGFTGAAPLSTMPGGWVLTPPGMAPGDVFGLPGVRVQASVVSPAYLQAIGARLVAGRWLDAGHGLDQPPSLLVNRTLARRFFGDRSPLSLSVDIGGRRWQVIGVVDDIRSRGLDVDPEPRAYLDPVRMQADVRAAGWDKFGFDSSPLFLSFAARVNGDPSSLAADVRRLVRQLGDSAAIDGVIRMDQVVSGALARPRFYALLLGLFAAIAAVVAVVGTYGLLSYIVTRRTQELAIRMALGAQRAKVLGLVLRYGVVLATIGIAFGLAGASIGARLLSKMLFGITPLDLTTFVAVSVMFGLVTVVACYIPARRAAVMDPVVALRSD